MQAGHLPRQLSVVTVQSPKLLPLQHLLQHLLLHLLPLQLPSLLQHQPLLLLLQPKSPTLLTLSLTSTKLC